MFNQEILNQKSDYRKFRIEGENSSILPSMPARVYKDDGWIDFYDFLGIRRMRNIDYLPYEEAREFVVGLGLKNQKIGLLGGHSRKTAEYPI